MNQNSPQQFFPANLCYLCADDMKSTMIKQFHCMYNLYYTHSIIVLTQTLALPSTYLTISMIFLLLIRIILTCRFLPYVGMVTIIMNDYPKFKVKLFLNLSTLYYNQIPFLFSIFYLED